MPITAEPPAKPKCPCCNGSGMHYVHSVAFGAASPGDRDVECSLCGGTGESWFDAQRNTCSGYRHLMRSYR